jgi:hypothetical protein
MTSLKAFRYDLVLVAHLSLLVCPCISAQTAQHKPVALTQADVETLSTRAPNQPIDWNWFYGAIGATPAEDREGVLKQLIASPREDLACEAAVYGIGHGYAALEGVISAQVSNWSPQSQSGLIGVVTNKRPVWLEIPRAVVRGGADRRPEEERRRQRRPTARLSG